MKAALVLGNLFAPDDLRKLGDELIALADLCDALCGPDETEAARDRQDVEQRE
jgi:hypothetical protein